MKTIECERIDQDAILINGKEVRKDMDGNWIGRQLNVQEVKYFNIFLQALRKSNNKLRVVIFKL